MLSHEKVLNEIISHTCHNPIDWESKDNDLAPKTFLMDLHCMKVMVTAQWKPNTEYEYEILDVKFIDE